MSRPLPAFAAVIFASHLLGQTAVGSIQGSLTGDDGSVLSGASIHYHRAFNTVRLSNGQLVPAPGEAVVDASVTADATGSFTAPNLPPGNYVLCVEAASAPYLDPCKWSAPIQVAVAASVAIAQPIILRRGVFLKVHVNDPLSVLPQAPDSALGRAPLIVGVVFGSGGFLGAANTGIGSAGRDYQIPVPAGVPLKLWVWSSRVALLNAGTVVNSAGGAALPFQAAAGVDQLFTFTAQAVFSAPN